MRTIFGLFRSILLFGLSACLLSFSFAEDEQSPTLSASSANGIQLEVFSQLEPLQINSIHSWHLRLSSSGFPVTGASITMSGGMPDHDHGLPTQARVTEELEPGVYLLEGIRFHMPGRWELLFSIEHEGKTDLATIEFRL